MKGEQMAKSHKTLERETVSPRLSVQIRRKFRTWPLHNLSMQKAFLSVFSKDLSFGFCLK